MKTMPQLARPNRGYRHTLDSALETLRDLGIDYSRITVMMAGRGWPGGVIVGQEPRPGARFGPETTIQLMVAGTGVFHGLPLGMWDHGTEATPGTAQLVGILDDPIAKAGHWIRAGDRLFGIHQGNLEACSRWITLFGLSPEDWPVGAWFHLAVLLPNLHRLAGSRAGVQLALDMILGLPLLDIRRTPSSVALASGDQSRLAGLHGRLGIDLVLSDHAEGLSHWTICIGPVDLARYFQLQQPVEKQRLKKLLGLTLPLYQEYDVSWKVLDPEAPMRLGSAEGNGVLGINSYFGTRALT